MKHVNVTINLAIRAVALVFQLLLQLALARFFGASGVATVQLFQSWTCIGGEAAALGLPQNTLKLLAVETQPAKQKALLIATGAHTLRISLALIAVCSISAAVLWYQHSSLAILCLCFGLSASAFAFLRISVEGLKALGRIKTASMLEAVLFSMLLFIIISIVHLLTTPALATNNWMVLSCTAIWLLLAITAWLYLHSIIPKTGVPTAYKQALINRSTWNFWGTSVGSIGLTSFPFIVMPFFANLDEIGSFALAYKLISPVGALLILLSAYYGPLFARLAIQSNVSELRNTLKQTQLASLALFIPLAAILLFSAKPLLAYFGKDFGNTHVFLGMLICAQLINAATGLSGIFLSMTGHEQLEFKTTFIALAGAFIFSLVLGSSYGIYGIAIAYSLSMAIKNLLSYSYAHRSLNTDSYPQTLKCTGIVA